MFDTYEPAIDSNVEQRRRSLVETLDPDALRCLDVFDHVADALATEAGTPAAQVNLMAVDQHLVLGAKGVDAEVLPRKNSLCNYPVADGETLVVENALEEPRLKEHPNVVGKPHVRFYVGIPLVVDNIPVGSVCAVGSESHSLEWTSRPALFQMVGLLERLLEARLRETARRDNSFDLLMHLTSAEAHVVRLTCSGNFGPHGNEEVRALRSALHDAEQTVHRELPSESDRPIGDAPTLPEEER